LTTIVVGRGEYHIDGEYLEISSAINIVGDPGVLKEKIVVVGGICFKRGIEGNCHLQHLTLRQAKNSGVNGKSSFTMDDVLVEQCTYSGVLADGTGGVGRCTNVEVRQCGWSGVVAGGGASITLIGAQTTVHHNCTEGNSDEYGLKVWGATSTIQLVSPLTKKQNLLDNGGGGNWGAEDGADIKQNVAVSQLHQLLQHGRANRLGNQNVNHHTATSRPPSYSSCIDNQSIQRIAQRATDLYRQYQGVAQALHPSYMLLLAEYTSTYQRSPIGLLHKPEGMARGTAIDHQNAVHDAAYPVR
jgi:hypothetical protein